MSRDYATYKPIEVVTTRWQVICDCPAQEGRVEVNSEKAVQGELMHHISQAEHQEWLAAQ